MASGYGSIASDGETVDLVLKKDEETSFVQHEGPLDRSRSYWKVGMVATALLALVAWFSTSSNDTPTTAKANDDIPLLGKSKKSHYHEKHL